MFKFEDICVQEDLSYTEMENGIAITKTRKRCVNSPMPLDFIYELSSDSYRSDLYDTDEKLITKMRTGRGDPERYPGRDFIYLDAFMG